MTTNPPALRESAVFRSMEQCLHFSFLMAILPATSKSSMQSMIERLMEEAGIVSVRERSSINFGGLTALEIRGQCAMVRGAVVHHLTQPEAAVIHARYAHQVEKAKGVRAVRDYVAPLLATQHESATLAMAWGIFCTPKQRDGISTRRIADEFKLSQSTVTRDQQAIRRAARSLESRGIERLRPMFERCLLVDAD